MKKLYLVRHAKSSWKEEGVHDMDRPLKGRGVRDAYNTSQWLREQGDRPEFIISSPATRALHTALIFSRNLE
ncbi:MAG TPA: histidine phosphatase family protein, partial [Cryomorphaceae bacterium]|nr:histidine phosphatase family protein [Cryomorphaceae bacterium]